VNDRPDVLQAVRFAVVGVLNTVVGLLVIVAARELGLSDYTANAVGYAAGLTSGFAVNRGWTFQDRANLRATAPRYLAAFAVSYGANLLILAAGLDAFHLHPNLAQACALATYSIVFFVTCRAFVFRVPASGVS
jgi:putative flippase GtrA